jgi:hypothetical protein
MESCRFRNIAAQARVHFTGGDGWRIATRTFFTEKKMKAVTIVAAAALLSGVTAASAQTSSPNADKPGVTSMEKKGSTVHNKAHHAKRSVPMRERSTTGSGSSEEKGVTPGSNPNPSWNRNPDPEVPGNTEE